MNSLNDKFATNLKRLRLGAKLSQAALAERAGLSVSYISMLERGERSPPLGTIEIFSKVLNRPATALLS